MLGLSLWQRKVSAGSAAQIRWQLESAAGGISQRGMIIIDRHEAIACFHLSYNCHNLLKELKQPFQQGTIASPQYGSFCPF